MEKVKIINTKNAVPGTKNTKWYVSVELQDGTKPANDWILDTTRNIVTSPGGADFRIDRGLTSDPHTDSSDNAQNASNINTSLQSQRPEEGSRGPRRDEYNPVGQRPEEGSRGLRTDSSPNSPDSSGGPNNPRPPLDTDGDKIPDSIDQNDDNDSIRDAWDLNPLSVGSRQRDLDRNRDDIPDFKQQPPNSQSPLGATGSGGNNEGSNEPSLSLTREPKPGYPLSGHTSTDKPILAPDGSEISADAKWDPVAAFEKFGNPGEGISEQREAGTGDPATPDVYNRGANPTENSFSFTDRMGRENTITITESGAVIQQVEGGNPYRISREDAEEVLASKGIDIDGSAYASENSSLQTGNPGVWGTASNETREPNDARTPVTNSPNIEDAQRKGDEVMGPDPVPATGSPGVWGTAGQQSTTETRTTQSNDTPPAPTAPTAPVTGGLTGYTPELGVSGIDDDPNTTRPGVQLDV